jgi:lipoprotein-releasing system permease protein
MAWRNLVAYRSKNGLSFMTIISILGVAVGVSALIIVLSVMGGFERDLKEKMLKGSPHMEILSENTLAGFGLVQYPLKKFREVFHDAVIIEPFTQADIVIKHGKHLSSGVLFGVEPDGGKLWGFDGHLINGKLSDIGKLHSPLISYDDKENQWPGLAIGDKLATQLGADIGDELTLLSPMATVSASAVMGGATLTRTYVLSGIFHTGLFNYDAKWVVVSLGEGRKFLQDYDPSLDEDKYVSGIGINIIEPYEVEDFVKRSKGFKGLKTLTWKQSNTSLILALTLEKITMGSILMLIVLVAAFSISGTMMMAVFHKKRQVCLLRSLGMTKQAIIKLFLFQAFTISSAGILLGLAFGLATCFAIYNLRYANLPPELLILKTFPVKFLPLEYAFICIFAWLLSLVGASYPAWIASKQDPSSGLRY